MKVNLTYFKQSGKYYAEGSFESKSDFLGDIYEEAKVLIRSLKCPGLSAQSSGYDYTVLVEVPDYSDAPPKLIMTEHSFTEQLNKAVAKICDHIENK